MTENNDLRRNASGCYDPVAYEAISRADSESARFNKLLKAIFIICELSGFRLEDRIVVKDKRTGRIWR